MFVPSLTSLKVSHLDNNSFFCKTAKTIAIAVATTPMESDRSLHFKLLKFAGAINKQCKESGSGITGLVCPHTIAYFMPSCYATSYTRIDFTE